MAKIAEMFSVSSGPHSTQLVDIGTAMIEGLARAKYTFALNKELYDYFPTPAAMKRMSDLKIGDYVEVTKVPPSGNIKFAYYSFKKTGTPSGAGGSGMTPMPQIADRNRYEEIKQDRISIAGFTQALIVRKEHDIETCKALALELVQWSTQKAEEMYEERHNPNL